MEFIDLFSGIGGFRLGMERAGHECVGYCEKDKFAIRSYKAMHSTEGEWYAENIRTVRASDLPRADVWTAGFPCQDISIAGSQIGFRGKHSSLFFAVTGLVNELEEKDKPSYLILENVKNLFCVNRGFDFAKLLIELDEIGYDAEWDILNTVDILPQNRERVFIVGHLRGRNTRKVFPIQFGSRTVDGVPEQSESTTKARIKQIGNIRKPTSWSNPTPGRVYDISGVAPTLVCNTGGGHEVKIYVNGRIRKLTPMEYFRLQGFSDELFKRAQAVNSDSQLYKQAANSVSVPVVYAIANRI